MAAPVGVVSSPVMGPVVMGFPASSRAVAGAGTGISPWAQRTVPLPTATGDASTRVMPRRSTPHMAPTMSTMASSAPTSWKWMRSTVVSWMAASATAMAWKAAMARSATPGAKPAAAIMSRMWEKWRCFFWSSQRTLTSVAPIPQRITRSASSLNPVTGSAASAPRSSSSGSPRSTRAPSVMSPEMPL